MKIYVASSWRNNEQPRIVKRLRELGHDVYDFKNPPGKTSFGWAQTALGKPERPSELVLSLEDRRCVAGFEEDMRHLRECDACVFVAPAGLSASLELGFAVGAGKLTIIYAPDDAYDERGLDSRGRPFEPELMWKMADLLFTRFEQLEFALTPGALQSGEA
jgi:hypothetical protein